jgi:hypothetical protein
MPALLFGLAIGRERFLDPTSWLVWALIIPIAALLVYQLFALRQPLRKLDANHAP